MKMTMPLRSLIPAGPLVAVLLTAGAPALADDVPNFDVSVICRATGQGNPGAGRETGCLADEQQARASLVKQWGQYPADDRRRCGQLVSGIAGMQSYVELLSCLEMARDVRNLPKNQD